MTNGPRATWRLSRESRLLLLTVAVCAIVLLVLARLRFPQAPAVVTATPPLERLAARASYDALAADIRRVEATIAGNLVVLRVSTEAIPPRQLRDLLGGTATPGAGQHLAALRVSADTAVAAVQRGTQVDGIVRSSAGSVADSAADGGGEDTASISAIDPIRHVARLHVPDGPVRPVTELPLAALQTPLYVVVVEGTQAGLTLRPVFLGRGDRFTSPRWSRPLLPLGAIAAAPGALVFSLAGEFVGMVVVEEGTPAIAAARDVLEAAERLGATPPAPPADLGIAVQPLTPPLAAALGARGGVVVATVDAMGVAAGKLQAADVITTVDGMAAGEPDEFLLRVASRPASGALTLEVIRDGAAQTIEVPLGASPAAPPALTLAAERGGTRVSSVPAESSASLRTGDLIVRAGSTSAPTPAQVRRALSGAAPSGFATLLVVRDGRQHVVAVPVAAQSDAATP